MGTDTRPDITLLRHEVAKAMHELAALLPEGIPATIEDDLVISRLTAYLNLLADVGKVMNLTSDANPNVALSRHVRDSLAPLLVGLAAPHQLLDIGSGGGFPAIPLALAWPDSSVTMTESIGKKARFLEEAVESLPLANARVVHGRVEDPATGLRGRSFDMVTVRGVARVATVFDYAEPLLAGPGGKLVLWKGERDLAELSSPALSHRLRQAHCNVSVRRYALPGVERNANLVILEMT